MFDVLIPKRTRAEIIYEKRLASVNARISDGTLKYSNLAIRRLNQTSFSHKLVIVNFMTGATLPSFTVPAIDNTGTNNYATAVNFTDSDVTADNVLEKVNSGVYLDLNCQITSQPCGMGFILTESLTVSSSITPMGGRNAANTAGHRFTMSSMVTQGTLGGSVSSSTDRTEVSDGSPKPKGLYSLERTSATDFRMYLNGSQQDIEVTSQSNFNLGGNLYLFASNTVGSPGGGGLVPTGTKMGGYYISTGLTPLEMAAFYEILRDFNAAIGRPIA